ncbi:hypothetical protein IKF25_00270 [Candidatus Saccharibacteria bacterium]|nr:hypothetical protein [Candidatus Saccharibacteria bacterium]
MGSGEKRKIPGTKSEWCRELPDDYDNSLVDKYGENYDNGWNFDEFNDDEDDEKVDSNKSREY